MGSKWSNFIHFGVIMFFRKASPQTEGRRHADHGIKFSPGLDSTHADMSRVTADRSALARELEEVRGGVLAVRSVSQGARTHISTGLARLA